MNPLKKLALYPITVTAVIVLVTVCNWLITALFSLLFNTTIAKAASSPIILIYVISTIATLYLCISACQYIDEKL